MEAGESLKIPGHPLLHEFEVKLDYEWSYTVSPKNVWKSWLGATTSFTQLYRRYWFLQVWLFTASRNQAKVDIDRWENKCHNECHVEILYSYFLQVETFPPGRRKDSSKIHDANTTHKSQE